MGFSGAKSLAQSSKLKGMAADFGRISNCMGNLANNMNEYFAGVAANACRAALERRKEDVAKIQIMARETANEISSIVDQIREEEKEERRSRGSGGGNVVSGGPGMFC